MMVKNECSQLAQTTLNSIKDYLGHIIVFDTGSTDGTQNLLRNYCQENDIRLDLKEGAFVNFAVSRNVLMDYCDELLAGQTDVWILQLDAHDELQNGERLVDFVENHKGPHSGAYVTQKWFSGGNLDSYYNVRLVKPHHEWRYDLDAVVHEYQLPRAIAVDHKPDSEIIFRTEGIILYQDRTTQGDASFRRFTRDKEMLYAKHQEKPREPRTQFYLAQTCGCLGQADEAYKMYLLRIKEMGFYEEIYQSYFRLGELSGALGHDWEESMMWYMKAFQHSQRAEPLVRIAEHYRDYNFQGEKQPEWHTCYMFASMACQLIYPVSQILFVDASTYTYKRHHLLGIAGFYVGRYKEGKEACLKAIEARNQQIDRDNLKFYLEKELDLVQGGQLGCPCLIAVTIGDREVRAKDEMDIKHDRQPIINETIDKIVSERAAAGKPVAGYLVDGFKSMNRPTTLPPRAQDMAAAPNMGVTSTPNQAVLNDLSTMARMPRKDRRARLREMVKEKKKAVNHR